MLHALELVGFKSFADRTRFEFAPGITCVVGPNGSGKSNVVDAIKWVLGEQSAKSLRGKEMADVIFNGSGGRHSLNSAEVTLTFDNTRRLLAIDTPEVHITRRVYRNGEGEYLINRQPCRLRDIRELFAGTGIATEAYSVIEQGKVDVLLQASPRDRRMIFEEAAGISRFKAKKIESLRRLERVEQNLLRLADIVEEVDHQLRNVRRQAAKAQRYQELADRLQALRTHLGQGDWRELGQRLAAIQQELTALRDEEGAATAQAEALEAQAIALDLDVAAADESLRAAEAKTTENREQIAALEATIAQQRGQRAALDEEIAQQQAHVAALSSRAGDLERQLHETQSALASAVAQRRTVVQEVADQQRTLTELTQSLDQLRAEEERQRAALAQFTDQLTDAGQRRSALEAEGAAVSATAQRAAARLAELARAHDQCVARRADLEHQLTGREEARAAAVDELARARQHAADLRARLAEKMHALGQLQQRHSGARERASLLEELEQRLEGLGAGVKEVIVRARAANQGPFREVLGLVADLLHVHVDVAPLVEIALGEAAQWIVLAPGSEFAKYLEEGAAGRIAGRVSFVPRDCECVAPESSLDRHPGVIGRADRFVDAPPEYQPLAQRLLGRTWFVERWADALHLASEGPPGMSFVTTAGEHLSPEGVMTFGARQGTVGLISRRSELRALRRLLEELQSQIDGLEEERRALEDEAERHAQLVEERIVAERHAVEQIHDLRARLQAQAAEAEHVSQQQATWIGEAQAAEARAAAVSTLLAEVQSRLAEMAETHRSQSGLLQELSRQFRRVDEERQSRLKNATAVQIELAKGEERVSNLELQLRQFERDQFDRRGALDEAQAQHQRARARAGQVELAILAAESQVAALYLRKQELITGALAQLDRRETLRGRRTQLSDEAQRHRARLRRLAEKGHAKDLAVNELRLQREQLASRLREDYAIDLERTTDEPVLVDDRPRAELEAEIADLREKLHALGSVNLEALGELVQLEDRHRSLSAQLTDLTSAKQALVQIIDRINVDSRRLFVETLETVRGHFQELFRKLFGGGQADIVLDEAVDILDSGIEIVARPPGKEPRSISLLSGGEKTLTCVALLLAVFRSRPSPFCVLDEVDAALDEANIERFIGVLRDFLAYTQFIIVTHSKKTMTCAHVLYGVTMQESGISKRVSVRFDDVSEDGRIRTDPAAEESGDTQAA